MSSRQRKNQIVLNTGFGASFNYGVQVGQGGIDLQGSSGVNGNVYANGPITGTSSSFISGTAIADGGLIQGQANGTGTPAMSLDFGNTAADMPPGFMPGKKGGQGPIDYKKGGKVSSASKRADGCAIRGKTRA